MGRIIAFVLLYTVLTFGFFKNRKDGLSTDLSASIKGVAAVLIVLTHCITRTASDESFWRNLSTGYLTVAVFFFLSGFGSAYGFCRKEGYAKTFLFSRFVRVYVPFFVALILYTAAALCVGIPVTFRGFLFGMVGKSDLIWQVWYVFAALFFYLFIWIAFRISSRNAVRIAVLGVLNLSFSFIVWRIVGTRDHWFISNFAFVLGAALQVWDPKLRYRKYCLPAAAVCAVGGFAIYPVCNRLFGGSIYPAYILCCNFGSGFLTAALILLLTVTASSNRITKYLGKISYEIYLYHVLFITLLQKYFRLGVFPLFLAVAALTIAFSALMHKPNVLICDKLCALASGRKARADLQRSEQGDRP